MSTTSCDQKESEVKSEVSRQENYVGELRTTIDQLRTQLSDVLRNVPQKEDAEAKVEEVLVPLAGKLKGVNNAMKVCLDLLVDILGRLEV